MNRIRARWWMDARWQDKLTGSSVSLDDVWKWRVIVIAWCEEGGYSKLYKCIQRYFELMFCFET